jgi:hypothetical protein
MAIRLQESLRGVFYAPFYVALARDAYAAEGWRCSSSAHRNQAMRRAT